MNTLPPNDGMTLVFAVFMGFAGAAPQDEMRNMGIDMQGLIDSGALELHYSEYGLGGGARYSGATPCTAAAAQPDASPEIWEGLKRLQH
jgi:hypothetical protein